ncbi:hypothetical protein GCM10010210_03280 [Pseudonocardia hydrocarbonoxydans]
MVRVQIQLDLDQEAIGWAEAGCGAANGADEGEDRPGFVTSRTGQPTAEGLGQRESRLWTRERLTAPEIAELLLNVRRDKIHVSSLCPARQVDVPGLHQ